MFSKTALAFLALGILCVNALAVPVAREPSPEPELQDLEARIAPFLPALAAGLTGTAAGSSLNIPKREVSGELFSREAQVGHLQDLVARVDLQSLTNGPSGLFSREPEDWAQWAGVDRGYVSKREPGKGSSPPPPKPVSPSPASSANADANLMNSMTSAMNNVVKAAGEAIEKAVF